MSQSFAVEATISKPVEEVWAVLTDWNNAHRWMSGVDRMNSSGETAIGQTITFHARGKERTSMIVSCSPGKSVVLRSQQGGVTADYKYELHPAGPDQTRATLVANCQTKGLFWTTMSPLLKVAVRLTDRGQMEALKKVVEES
jgi:carbon monoxide dehydrogenase subunit G